MAASFDHIFIFRSFEFGVGVTYVGYDVKDGNYRQTTCRRTRAASANNFYNV